MKIFYVLRYEYWKSLKVIFNNNIQTFEADLILLFSSNLGVSEISPNIFGFYVCSELYSLLFFFMF